MHWSDFASHLSGFSPTDQKLIEAAYKMGEKAHGDQKRQSGEPYFTHPIAVATMLIDLDADAETVISALLHDTIEDTDLKPADIEKKFGSSVVQLIDGITKISASEVADQPSLDSKIESLRKIFTALEKDVRIIVIKLLDRLHNMQTIASFRPEKRQRYAQETLDTYVKVADRLGMVTIGEQLEALCLQELNPPEYEALTALRERNRQRGKKIISEIETTIKKESKADVIRVAFEDKNWKKLRAQLQTNGGTVTGISDLLLIIEVATISDCYEILGTLHQLWRREHLSFQDFINSPMINGYRGLHTTIILEDGTRIRCKIRSSEMERYAKRGVTSLCFDSKAVGLAEYLPWTDLISPLSKDTAKRSNDFWESLKSDVLGESIVVHTMDDQAIALPAESTVLDAAFYCYGNKALRIKKAFMNGVDVPLRTTIENGSTLTIEIGQRNTVDLHWLDWVYTGLATAIIRQSLTGQSKSKKVSKGRQILQDFMHEKHQGYIEEIDLKALERSVARLGYHSIDEAFSGLAQGHIEPSDILRSLRMLSKSGQKIKQVSQKHVVRCMFMDSQLDVLQQLVNVFEARDLQTQDIRIQNHYHGESCSVYIQTDLRPEDIKQLRKDLTVIGAKDIDINPTNNRELSLLGVVIFFWAINPVIAKRFIMEGMNPLTLVSYRLLFFALFVTVFFVIWRMFMGNLYRPIKNSMRLAILPGVLMLALAVFTYYSISLVPPSVHLTILRFNVVVIPLLALHKWRDTKPNWNLLGLLILVCAIALTVLPSAGISILGISLSLLTLLIYAGYSLAIEHVLQKHKIGARYPAIMFPIGVVIGLAGALLMPRADWNIITTPMIGSLALYVLFCVFIPHTAFYAVLKNARFKHVTDMFLLEIPIAMIAEVLLLSITLPTHVYLVITVLLLSLLAVRLQLLPKLSFTKQNPA